MLGAPVNSAGSDEEIQADRVKGGLRNEITYSV
jgi:hypothetical protein